MNDHDFAAALAACKSEDFDGHTDFDKLTPPQRIEWLEQVTWFVYENRGIALSAGRPAKGAR